MNGRQAALVFVIVVVGLTVYDALLKRYWSSAQPSVSVPRSAP